MNSTMPETTLPYDLSARLSYLGELFVHRRVLVVSDDPSAAMFLAGLNARYVCSISEKEVTAPAGHRTTVEFKIVSFDDLRFRDGMFDVALIPDLGALPPSAGLFVELRRVVGRRGRVVVAAVNPACTSRLAAAAGSGIDYYEMYDLLSHTFDVVQMAGQAPFVGYAVSDLGAGEDPDISFDGSLMADATEEIEWFIAVCGAEPVSLEGLAIVQVPLSSLSLRGDGSAAAALSQENDRLSQEVEVLREDVARLDQDLRLAEDDLRNLQQSAPDPDELESLKAELHRVKLEVGTRGVRIETLENDLEHERREAERPEHDQQAEDAQDHGLSLSVDRMVKRADIIESATPANGSASRIAHESGSSRTAPIISDPRLAIWSPIRRMTAVAARNPVRPPSSASRAICRWNSRAMWRSVAPSR